MKIYTKGGDGGSTTLAGGSRIRKDSPRVNAYGNIDELISWLGLLRVAGPDIPYADNLKRIQESLMLIAAHFAADEHAILKIKPLKTSEIHFLEIQIDEISEKLPPQTAFILPGGTRLAAECHIARTVCRRTERSAVGIFSEENLENDLKYLNRLSDYLFVYARFIAMITGVRDDLWLP